MDIASILTAAVAVAATIGFFVFSQGELNRLRRDRIKNAVTTQAAESLVSNLGTAGDGPDSRDFYRILAGFRGQTVLKWGDERLAMTRRNAPDKETVLVLLGSSGFRDDVLGPSRHPSPTEEIQEWTFSNVSLRNARRRLSVLQDVEEEIILHRWGGPLDVLETRKT